MDTPIAHNHDNPTIEPADVRADAQSPANTWMHRIAACVILGVAVLLAHGWSLHDGLGLDDNWHYRTFRESGWSLPELLDATIAHVTDTELDGFVRRSTEVAARAIERYLA